MTRDFVIELTTEEIKHKAESLTAYVREFAMLLGDEKKSKKLTQICSEIIDLSLEIEKTIKEP